MERFRISGIFGVIFAIAILSNGCVGEKEIPITRFSQNVGGPTMTFLYWQVFINKCYINFQSIKLS